MDLILYNPKSKNSKANVQTHKLVRTYKKEGKPFRLKSILKIHDIKEYLDKRQHYEKIILLGGDGTIHQLINDLADYDIKQQIYIKRNGSGNDFLRSLKNNDEKPQYLMQATLDNKSSHYFMNGTGIGIDGLTIDFVDKAKSKGKLTYFLSSLRAVFSYVPEPVDVEIDGKKMHFKKTYLAVVNNGRFVGGGMEMTPKARIDDENLDVMIVHKIPKFMLLLVFSSIYLGLHTKLTRWVYYTKCKHFKVKFSTPQITESDGEKTYDIQSLEVKSSGKKVHLKAYEKGN